MTRKSDENSPIFLDEEQGGDNSLERAPTADGEVAADFSVERLNVGLCSTFGAIAILLGANTLSGMMSCVQTFKVADELLFPGRNYPMATQTWMSRWQLLSVALTLLYPKMNSLRAFKASMFVIAACQAAMCLVFSFGAGSPVGYAIALGAGGITCGVACLAISAVLGLLSRIDGRLAGHAGVGIGLSGVIAMLYAWPICMLARQWHGPLMMACGTFLGFLSLFLVNGLMRDPLVRARMQREDKEGEKVSYLPLLVKGWKANITAALGGLTLFLFYPAQVVKFSQEPFVIATLFGMQNVGEIFGRLLVSWTARRLTMALGLILSAMRFAFVYWTSHVLSSPADDWWKQPAALYAVMVLQGFTFGVCVNLAFIKMPDFFDRSCEKEASGLIVGSFNGFGILLGTLLMPLLYRMGIYPTS